MTQKGYKMKFLDKAKIYIKAGDGGNGAAKNISNLAVQMVAMAAVVAMLFFVPFQT